MAPQIAPSHPLRPSPSENRRSQFANHNAIAFRARIAEPWSCPSSTPLSPSMPPAPPPGLVPLVFTDMERSSDLWQEHGAAFEPVLDQHNRLLREVAAANEGFEVKTVGDAFF